MNVHALGKHLLLELYDCEPGILDDLGTVSGLMVDAAHRIGATIINLAEHRFVPQGVSVVVMIAESHLSIHTWPEHGFAAVDVFTCSESMDPSLVIQPMQTALGAVRISSMEVPRGIVTPALAGIRA